MGLLLPHKRTAYIYPDMVSFSPAHGGPQKGGGKRKEITAFSSDSRYRLFQLLHRVKFDRMSFVTLTYPADFPTDSRIYHAHLKEYRRRMERTYGKVSVIWRLEFQERGAPHFHLMYFDAPFIPIYDWVNLWDSVINTPYPFRIGNSVDIKFNRHHADSRQIGYYVGKYLAKVDTRTLRSIPEKPGRMWGKWNVQEIDPVKIDLMDYEVKNVVSRWIVAKRKTDWLPEDLSICTLFGDQMGSEAFKTWIESQIVSETERNRVVNIPKVTFST